MEVTEDREARVVLAVGRTVDGRVSVLGRACTDLDGGGPVRGAAEADDPVDVLGGNGFGGDWVRGFRLSATLSLDLLADCRLTRLSLEAAVPIDAAVEGPAVTLPRGLSLPAPLDDEDDEAVSRSTIERTDGRTKTPWSLSHWKYLTPCTAPSFFPVGPSSSRPTQAPAEKRVSPVYRTTARRPSWSRTGWLRWSSSIECTIVMRQVANW